MVEQTKYIKKFREDEARSQIKKEGEPQILHHGTITPTFIVRLVQLLYDFQVR